MGRLVEVLKAWAGGNASARRQARTASGTFYLCHGPHKNDPIYTENLTDFFHGRGIAVETIATARRRPAIGAQALPARRRHRRHRAQHAARSFMDRRGKFSRRRGPRQRAGDSLGPRSFQHAVAGVHSCHRGQFPVSLSVAVLGSVFSALCTAGQRHRPHHRQYRRQPAFARRAVRPAGFCRARLQLSHSVEFAPHRRIAGRRDAPPRQPRTGARQGGGSGDQNRFCRSRSADRDQLRRRLVRCRPGPARRSFQFLCADHRRDRSDQAPAMDFHRGAALPGVDPVRRPPPGRLPPATAPLSRPTSTCRPRSNA